MTNTYGVNILTRNAPASRGPAFPTGTLFVASKNATGPITAPLFVQSIADLEAGGITRTTNQALWDYLDVFFREGGNSAYVITWTTAGEANYKVALEKFDKRLGPGQVAVIGEAASAALYKVIAEHCEERNRVGLLDVLETDTTQATLVTTGAFGTGLVATLKERVAVFGSWLEAPPAAGVVGGVVRKVPASCAVAALCQRVDEQGNPNQPAGGAEYPLQYVSGIVFDPTDVERNAIFAAGVNTFKKVYGQIINYGFVTPTVQSASTPFWQLNCARARMYLLAEGEKLATAYYMRDIDAAGKLASSLGSKLEVVCKKLWQAGGLYGRKPEEAYEVNVGVTVNRESEIATGTLNAVVAAKFSLYSAQVNVTLVSVPLTGVV